MKEIKLTQGKSALVDDEDYNFLIQWKWHITSSGSNSHIKVIYAARGTFKNRETKTFRMHNEIMNPPKGMVVDHIDHDGLNNQRSNLRICTPKENRRNQRGFSNSKSKYIGVLFLIDKRWKNEHTYIKSKIKFDGKAINLGTFKTEEEAARAYDKMAFKYYGEFANLNFPEEYKTKTA